MAIAVRSDSTARREETEAGRLFEEYSERILGYCLRYLGNRAEAEDAVQTTFLYAHRALQRGVVPESEYAWLHSIAKNVCRWQQRTIARRGRLSSDVELDELPAMQGATEEEKELLMGLQEALASIPEEQRRALVLREWHGLSSKEVAARLGLSAPATYQLLTRARHSLARALTSVPRRPALSLDFGALLFKLKALLAGATAKAVATTVVVAGVAVGGVAVERAVDAKRPGVSRPSSPSPLRSQQPPSGEIRDARAAAGEPKAAGARFFPVRDGARVDSGSVDQAGGPVVNPAEAPDNTAPSGGAPAPGAEDAGTTSPAPEVEPGSDPQLLPKDPPAPPPPPVTLPPIELPLPEVELPPLPPISVPPTDGLPLPLDPPELPPLELPVLPPLELPKLPL